MLFPSLGVSCEEPTPVKTEEFSSEGSTVTLSYNYLKKGTGLDYYFFWYRQYSGNPPEFLISHQESGEILSDPVSGLSVTMSGNKTRMDLNISSAAVTDSAVYYCALRPTVTGNTKTLYKNLWSKDNTILHNIH
uniref:Immunoglobulin V-set domain-containing protein n=1 Tax=Seriola lalandi dorsalis TaxID=1841481 RepID=A0A3B4XYN3_SERLL